MEKNDYYSNGYAFNFHTLSSVTSNTSEIKKKHQLLLPNKSECHKREIGFAEKDAIKVSN